MSKANVISLAVWDAPIPVVAGEAFEVKVGAKAADSRPLAGCHIGISDADGATLSSGALGDAPWPGTEALYWVALSMLAPATPQVAAYRVIAALDGAEAAATAFTVVAAKKPEHSVSINVADRDTAKPLADVEVRLGPFHARTNADGRAVVRVCNGPYEVRLWRSGYLAVPQSLTVEDDTRLDLVMQHVPEAHPDARWIR